MDNNRTLLTGAVRAQLDRLSNGHARYADSRLFSRAGNRITVVPSTMAHIPAIARRMRLEDTFEIWQSHHMEPLNALEIGFNHARHCWTAYSDDVPAAMFGVAASQADPSIGVPWLLGTDDVTKYRREFLRKGLIYVQLMRREFSLLVNYVHVTNTVAIDWLEWMGFQIDEPARFGIEQDMFCRFSMRGEPCVVQ